MIRTIEAIIDETGTVRLTQPFGVKGIHRALVTVLEELPEDRLHVALLSESSLAEDWAKPEEDKAWLHLQ